MPWAAASPAVPKLSDGLRGWNASRRQAHSAGQCLKYKQPFDRWQGFLELSQKGNRDGDLQRRDPDSQERTKLGLEMIATRGCVIRRCVGLSLWQLGICSTCNEFVQQSSCSGLVACDKPHPCCPLALELTSSIKLTLSLLLLLLYYFKCSLHCRCWKSNWTNASLSANDLFFLRNGLFFFFPLSLNHWSSSGGKVEDVTAWNCISYFSSLEVSLEAPDQRIALPPLAFSLPAISGF